jgi:hypothetical protein
LKKSFHPGSCKLHFEFGIAAPATQARNDALLFLLKHNCTSLRAKQACPRRETCPREIGERGKQSQTKIRFNVSTTFSTASKAEKLMVGDFFYLERESSEPHVVIIAVERAAR